MHKIKEVIRLKSAGLTLRVITNSAKLSLGAVSKYAKAAEQAGLTWPLSTLTTKSFLISHKVQQAHLVSLYVADNDAS